MASHEGEQRLPVIVVASWYPGVDDPARGRFVADQVEALIGTGRIQPLMLSFEPIGIDGTRLDRPEQLARIRAHRQRALQDLELVTPAAWSVATEISTARIPTLIGIGRATRPGSDGDLRREALLELAERLNISGTRGVVHAHTAYPDGFAAAGLAKRLGWPLIITEHATFVARQLGQPEERRRYLEAVASADRFLAVSDGLATELAAAIPELDGKLEVMPNTVPLEQYVAVGMEGRRQDELLFVGYRKPIKGIATLIRAFVDVRDARPNATLRLVGRSLTAEIEETWKRLAEDLGVADAVHFDEPLDRAGVARAMNRASILVHPSVRETFGMTTLEALASGMPVVAARSGGISGLLEDPQLGEVVPPFDSRALSKAVLRVLERRESFDPRHLRAAVEPYSATTVAGRLVALYEQSLDGRSRAPDVHVGSPPPIGGKGALPDRVLLVGNDTPRVKSLIEQMPAELLERITLVTAGVDAEGEPLSLPDALARVVVSHHRIERELSRVGLLGPRGGLADRMHRTVLNPPAAMYRRLHAQGRAEQRAAAVVAGIRAAVQDAQGTAAPVDTPMAVLCCDAVDFEAVAPLLRTKRLSPLPGGPLWLADRHAATAAAGAPPAASADRRTVTAGAL